MVFDDILGKATAYLPNSFCCVLYKDEPLGIFFVILEFDPDGQSVIIISNGARKSHIITNKTIKDYEFISPPLGNFFLPESGYFRYVERIPRRMWRVGVTSNNVTQPNIFRHNPKTIIEGLTTILEKNYSNFHDATKISKETGGIVPFTRKYAVSNGKILLYAGEEVGVIKNGMVSVNTSRSAFFHQQNIGSLCNLTFFSTPMREINYDEEDL